ncbi:MAG: alpha/beta fold hydrolase [Planctomycetaceae bacterium]|nr:alpha/beta fold hydrolase [Planctomycetaceae bacterium]
MAWFIFSVVGTIVLADLVVRVFYVRLVLPRFENKPPFNATEHPIDPNAEPVTLTTRDGVTLRGGLYRTPDLQPRGLVLFCPELGGDHSTAGWYCEALLQAGFDVLSVDFRGQGESDGQPGYSPIHWPTEFELCDLRSVLDFVDARDDLRELPLCLMGISRGSLAGLIVAANEPRIRAVCGEGTYTIHSLMEHFTLKWAELYVSPLVLRFVPMWHYRLTLWLVRWVSEYRRKVRYALAEPVLPKLRQRPVLLIAGERDNYVPLSVTRGIARRLGPNCTVWTAPGAKHNQARDAAKEDFDRQIVEFFSAVCPAPLSVPHATTVA